MQTMGDGYVTTGQAARELGVTPSALTRWANDGKVKPALRTPGGHFRWDLADLRRQLAALTAETGTDGR
jgi:DNA-binding transcriptional MerR regulator